MHIIRLVIISTCLLLTSCATLDKLALKAGFTKLSKMESELAQIRSDNIIKIEMAKKEVSDSKDIYWKQLLNNYQDASNESYGTWIAAKLNQQKNPSRIADIVFLRSDATLKFSMSPTIEAIMEQNKTLLEELDEQKVTNQQLSDRYKIINDEAIKNAQILKEKDDEIVKAKEHQVEIEIAAKNAIDAKQEEIKKQQDIIIKTQQNQLINAENENKIKIWLVSILMIVAIAAGAAAIFAPIPTLKPKLALFAGICFIGAIAIPFLKAWMILLPLAIVVVGFMIVGGFMLYNFIKEHKTAGNTYSAIQQFKENAPEEYQKLKTQLIEWQSKYKKGKDGVIVKVADSSVSKLIDQHLIETNQK